MGKEFEIVREYAIAATPQQVWDAVTDGTAAWLWPMEYEHRLGGNAAFGGTVTAWDPPHHFATRVEGPDGWYNNLENVIEARGDGAWVRYVHSGVFTDDWEGQYDGADKHTDFYLHTLKLYLERYTGRRATYASADGPETAKAPGSFQRLRAALGVPESAAVGDRVRVEVPGVGPLDTVVDYRNEWFLGLSTDDAMYRFFGRDAFGAPVALTIHHFGEIDPKRTSDAWQSWLETVYA
jgi:hypothetical protein